MILKKDCEVLLIILIGFYQYGCVLFLNYYFAGICQLPLFYIILKVMQPCGYRNN